MTKTHQEFLLDSDFKISLIYYVGQELEYKHTSQLLTFKFQKEI